MSYPPAAYPFLAILYTATNFKDLATPVAKSLGIALGTSLATVIPLVLLTLNFQAKGVASFLRGLDIRLGSVSVLGIRLSKWIALLLCMGEASLVVMLTLGSKLDSTRVGLFDDVLTKRSNVRIGPYVADPKAVLPTPETPTALSAQRQSIHEFAQLATYRPNATDIFHPSRIPRAALGYALEFVPVVGPLAYAYLECERTGIEAHHRLFTLKKMQPEERGEWVLRHRDEYSQFGFVAAALEAVPIVSTVTKFTNAVAAAMWAADLEKRQEQLRAKKGFAGK
ncbi:uncharacterized protein EV422DRAFT_569047 [Fimicolochytrium jonesii]|uniref:uncharacterized protein n=1 Tax=Fimicolochytrium jonesii TaxID=1396493 RepID=UPI0022FE77E5|nr:uncharacterized protein EV422DRAFT_569047 [Fimicolochytrium jonesii]KAI8819169.1 hypothetical protein EV422DRAFT_569047 [Fimicolochytrium jonesii]